MEQTEVKTQEQAQSTEEKTFTQAELNAIVQKRVGELTAKYGNYEELKEKAQKYDTIEEESKTELQKAKERADALDKELQGMKRKEALRTIRDEVAKEKNIPAELLTGETKEECTAQADKILAFAKPDAYPNVKDGGEVRSTGGKKETRDLFEQWVKQMDKGGS